MDVLLEGLNRKDPFLKELQTSSNHFGLILSNISLSKLPLIFPGLEFTFEEHPIRNSLLDKITVKLFAVLFRLRSLYNTLNSKIW